MSDTPYPTLEERDPNAFRSLFELEQAALAYATTQNEADQANLLEIAWRFAAGTERLEGLLAAAKAGGASMGIQAADAWHATQGNPGGYDAQEKRVSLAFEVSRLLKEAGLEVSDPARKTEPEIMLLVLGDVRRALLDAQLVKRGEE